MLSIMPAAAAVQPVEVEIDRLQHAELDAEALSLHFVPATAERAPSFALTAQSLRIPRLGQRLREVRFECTPVGPGVAEAASAAMPIVGSPSVAGTQDAGRASTSPDSRAAAPVDADTATASATDVEAGANPGIPAPADTGTDATADATNLVAAGPWRCEGPLRWRGGAANWRLSLQADEALTAAHLTLAQGRSEIQLDLPLSGSPLAVEARRLTAAWLQPVVPQLRWQGGRIDGRIERQADGERWRGSLRLRDFSAEASNGAVAFAGMRLDVPVDVTLRGNGETRFATRATLHAGELLAGAAYVGWPEGSRVGVELSGTVAGGRWGIDRLSVTEDGFEATARAVIEPGAEDWLKSLGLETTLDLSRRYPRYLDAWMASLGHAGLQAAGQLKTQLELGAGGLQSLRANLGNVSLRHPQGRFAIEGVDGDVAFTQGGEAQPFAFDWQALSLHAIDLGAGRLKASAQSGEIRAQPLQLSVFDGRLVASDLVLRPLADDPPLLRASVELADIDIAGLAGAFGWPRFAGQLDGRLPSLTYGNETLAFGGEIAVQAFDGEVRARGLSIERPFGVAPALSGEIRIDGIDLVPMTEVFGLGRIEGRLDGRIDGLRLLDWRPTAFDAHLETADGGRRRISQLAVEQLTQIGGGGGAAGIQGRLMGMFDSFGYRKIALSCRLANDVCEMGGIDEAGGGYTILQGSGLPLITIRGFSSRVDWPVLVERLQSVASGQRPVVD